VKLFADRARQADPRFVLDNDSERMAARLVERLDGMPLAIELAAARVEALGLALMLDRLEDSLHLLVSPDRAPAARHQSLAATVAWSYQLLSEQEQRIFRRLSIFPGQASTGSRWKTAGHARPAGCRARDHDGTLAVHRSHRCPTPRIIPHARYASHSVLPADPGAPSTRTVIITPG
jgi:hypothetical protein